MYPVAFIRGAPWLARAPRRPRAHREDRAILDRADARPRAGKNRRRPRGAFWTSHFSAAGTRGARNFVQRQASLAVDAKGLQGAYSSVHASTAVATAARPCA